MGSSYTEYGDRGFWTRDAALETALALIVVELGRAGTVDHRVDRVLDDWTLQAVGGFSGCVSAELDSALLVPGLADAACSAIERAVAGLPQAALVGVEDSAFVRRAERVTEGSRWFPPKASTSWVREVLHALADLIAGRFPADPPPWWFVGADGLVERSR